MTREQQKIEAITRMKALELHNNAIREFDKEDLINLSENYGALYWLHENQKEYVKEFEQKYNAVVYHVIRSLFFWSGYGEAARGLRGGFGDVYGRGVALRIRRSGK